MFKRRLKLLGRILLGLIVLPVVLLLFERFRGEIALAQYERQLIRKGEKLAINELVALAVPDSENRAMEFLQLFQTIQTGDILPLQPPPCMKLQDHCLRPLLGFRELTWKNSQKWDVTNSWREVELELLTNRVVMQALREVLNTPALNHNLDYAKGIEILVPHLKPARELSRWYSASAQLSLQRGDNVEAFHDLMATFRLPSILESDRLLYSESVRVQIANHNMALCWEALQSDDWTDDQLAQMKGAWAQTTFLTNMIQALRMERAIHRSEFETVFGSARSGPDIGSTIFHVTPGWVDIMPDWMEDPFKKRVVPAIWRFAWLKQDEKNLLEAIDRLLQICQSASTNRSKSQVSDSLDQFESKYLPQECRTTMFPVSELFLMSNFNLTKKVFRSESQRSLALCAIALKRYSLKNGKLPLTLSALVPEFLPSVPVDYMDGESIKYRLNENGGFDLYSVGEDGRDDGGDLSLSPATNGWTDLWKRRDYVWPTPATPEEVETYRQSAGQN